MAHHCKDCSYRGEKSGQLGECPACGSFNFVQRAAHVKEQPSAAKWRLVLLVVLWGSLIVMLIGKLSH